MSNDEQIRREDRQNNIETDLTNNTVPINSAENVYIAQNINITKNIYTNDALSLANETYPKNLSQSLKTPDKSHCVLKEKLQNLYRTITLPTLAWQDGGDDMPMEKYYVKLQLNKLSKKTELSKSIDINEIFNPINSKKRLRILIEGQPGFGKTTLANKLAYDWANNEEYTKHFELVFFIPLRDLGEKSIEEKISDIGNDCGYLAENDNVIQILNDHKSNTLFILDGLDEVPMKERQEIVKLLFKNKYPEVTIVVSCRTDLFKIGKNEMKNFFGLPNKCQIFWDKRITILGIKSLNDKQEFLKKFIPEAKEKNMFQHLLLQVQLFDSPLFLIMLPVIFEDDKNIDKFSTQTEFYKKFFNCILKHSCIKRRLDIDTNFDLFNIDSASASADSKSIQEQTKCFGEFSVQKLVKNQLMFESNDLTKAIFEFGFLINHKKSSKFKSEVHYEALHLSMIEFTVAYALWMELKLSNSSPTKNLFAIINHFLSSGGTSLTMLFLASLMEDDLDRLLSRISTFSGWFCLDFDLTVKLLSECSSSNISKSKLLKNFIPPDVRLPVMRNFKWTNNREYENTWRNTCRELLQYGSNCSIIKTIEINNYSSGLILNKPLTTCLKINSEISGLVFTFYLKVEAAQDNFKTIPFDGQWKRCLEFAASPFIESCDLDICNSSAAEELLKLMTQDEKFNKIKYNYLVIDNLKEIEKEVLIKLIKNDQVQSLELVTIPATDLTDLWRTAAESSYLTTMYIQTHYLIGVAKNEIINYKVSVDLHDLTDGGNKKYRKLNIRNCTLSCKKPLSPKNCCDYLRIHKNQNIEAITKMEPSSLCCEIKEMCDLIKKDPTWTGFNNITILLLYGVDDIFLDLPSTWKNLQTLYIHFKPKSDKEEMIAKFIHNLPIVKLVFENRFKTTSKLFKCMNELWIKKKNSQLKTIDFIFNNEDKFKSEVEELTKGLKCKHWDEVNLMSRNTALFTLIECLENFNVSYYDIESSMSHELDKVKLYAKKHFPHMVYHGLSVKRK